MKKNLLLILAFSFAAFCAGGDTLVYDTQVDSIQDGDTIYSDLWVHSPKDSIQSIINGRLGNVNLADDADIKQSKIDTTLNDSTDWISIRTNHISAAAGVVALTADTVKGLAALKGNPNIDSLTGYVAVEGGILTDSISISDTLRITGTGGLISFNSNQATGIRFGGPGGSAPVLYPNTDDGADSKGIYIAGGGSVSSSRGAYIGVFGEEFSGYNGDILLATGDQDSIKMVTYGGLVDIESNTKILGGLIVDSIRGNPSVDSLQVGSSQISGGENFFLNNSAGHLYFYATGANKACIFDITHEYYFRSDQNSVFNIFDDADSASTCELRLYGWAGGDTQQRSMGIKIGAKTGWASNQATFYGVNKYVFDGWLTADTVSASKIIHSNYDTKTVNGNADWGYGTDFNKSLVVITSVNAATDTIRLVDDNVPAGLELYIVNQAATSCKVKFNRAGIDSSTTTAGYDNASAVSLVKVSSGWLTK